MIKEKKGQETWLDHGFEDLRHIPKDALEVGSHINAGSSFEEAIAILESELGFTCETQKELEIRTPIGSVSVKRDMLGHIVEKRLDARERYVRMAISTMRDPFEVWAVEYDDESIRHAYIGVFNGKTHLLVIVTRIGEDTLWNFMHGDAKSINKHRHGQCLHRQMAMNTPSVEVKVEVKVEVELEVRRV